MAKKNNAPRRVPRSSTPRTFGDGQPSAVAQPTPAGRVRSGAPRPVEGSAVRPAVVAPARRSVASFRSPEARSQAPLPVEYRHVGGDLRQLGVLSVITFAVMIVLGIVIR